MKRAMYFLENLVFFGFVFGVLGLAGSVDSEDGGLVSSIAILAVSVGCGFFIKYVKDNYYVEEDDDVIDRVTYPQSWRGKR